jgi:hypothetical protein
MLMSFRGPDVTRFEAELSLEPSVHGPTRGDSSE